MKTLTPESAVDALESRATELLVLSQLDEYPPDRILMLGTAVGISAFLQLHSELHGRTLFSKDRKAVDNLQRFGNSMVAEIQRRHGGT